MRLWTKRAALWLLILLPLILGFVAGVTMRLLAMLIAAAVEGYQRGRGNG